MAAFLSSAISVDKTLEAGQSAPKIETIDGEAVAFGDNDSNKKTVISFWSPKKPASRITNKELSLKYGNDSKENANFISICTDTDTPLMREVVKIDGIQSENVYAFTEISQRVFKDYDVKDNPKAFVVDENGKILEII